MKERFPKQSQVTGDPWAGEVAGRLTGEIRSFGCIAALPVVVLVLLLGACALPVQPSRTMEQGIPVRFAYVDAKAKLVCLAGSFNDWSVRSHCLTRSGDTWSLEVFLPPGRHQYALVIDGVNWREDPGAMLWEDTGFGMRNSIVIVD